MHVVCVLLHGGVGYRGWSGRFVICSLMCCSSFFRVRLTAAVVRSCSMVFFVGCSRVGSIWMLCICLVPLIVTFTRPAPAWPVIWVCRSLVSIVFRVVLVCCIWLRSVWMLSMGVGFRVFCLF